MNNIVVSCDAEVIEEVFKTSPYNLKNDIRDLTETQIKKIETAVGEEIMHGFGRNECALLYKIGTKLFVGYAKIRCGDEKRNVGKSNGYRCIVIVDKYNNCAFILHVYTHAKKDNLSHKEKNSLRKIVDEYYESIGK